MIKQSAFFPSGRLCCWLLCFVLRSFCTYGSLPRYASLLRFLVCNHTFGSVQAGTATAAATAIPRMGFGKVQAMLNPPHLPPTSCTHAQYVGAVHAVGRGPV